MIKTNDYDAIVIVDTFKSFLFIPLVFTLRRKHTKIISWEHFNYCSDAKYTARWLARKVSAIISDVVVVLTEADYNEWKNTGCSEKKLKTIYNYSCFESHIPKYDRNKKKILAIGRLEEQKGFDYLLQIWRKIEDEQEMNDIWEKKLYFLIPFYIFVHEANFQSYNSDEKLLSQLMNEFSEICTRLGILADEEEISELEKRTIIELSKKVVDYNVPCKVDTTRERDCLKC